MSGTSRPGAGGGAFANILIANRGEIACRVIATAKRLGYRTVAVYSEADAGALHVAQADVAVYIGKAPAPESYLHIDALLAAARATGADAVHPGYGFLSERADFARACADAGLVFIGPPVHSMEAMGNKAMAKRKMREAGVPCVPGYLGDAQDEETFFEQAAALGFPLLVKAQAGGGGRGIRRVQTPAELPDALASARREAQSAFGDGSLMLERLIPGARHIEIQVFADRHGNVVHMGERDCTAQRRRQKLIEEAPSPIVSEAMRTAMGQDALQAARSVGYVGAGTVEFIVDEDLRYYFLEMNTRLQVEHPVTECVTGLDLVEWQLRIAGGEPLPLRQDQIRCSGHAIEARLYAEDPGSGFRPQSGLVLWWRPQTALRPGMRIDTAVCEGQEITPYYDALIAKLIVHGQDRADAIRRLGALIEDAPLLGLPTNGHFLRELIRESAFSDAHMHTTLIDDWLQGDHALLQLPRLGSQDWLCAAAWLVFQDRGGPSVLRPASVAAYDLLLRCGQEQKCLRVQTLGGQTEIALDGKAHAVQWQGKTADGRLRLVIDGLQRSVCAVLLARRAGCATRLQMVVGAASWVFEEPSAYPLDRSEPDALRVASPVAGTVVQLRVQPGDTVVQGQPLVCVEAMKMETWIAARRTGRVTVVYARIGEPIAADATVIELEAEA